MRYITLNPSGELAQLVERGLCKADVRSSSLLFSMELRFLLIPCGAAVARETVNFQVASSNLAGGVCPISIVVMQQFCKLQRTVQFCYGA